MNSSSRGMAVFLMVLLFAAVVLLVAAGARADRATDARRVVNAITAEFGAGPTGACFWKIAYRESTLNPYAANWSDQHADGSRSSFGALQVGALWRRPGETVAAFAHRMFDPVENAAAAHRIYRADMRRGAVVDDAETGSATLEAAPRWFGSDGLPDLRRDVRFGVRAGEGGGMIDREAELLLELQAALLTGDMDEIIDVLVRIDEWSMSLPEIVDDAAVPFIEDHVAAEEEVALTEHGSLAAALVAAQAKMPAVAKDSENPHFKSRFASLDSLIAATRPPLNECGVVISQIPTANEQGEPVLRTTLLHGPSGERLEWDTPLFISRMDMQGFGAAITYARRYAWAAVLGIASEEDTDGNVPEAAPSEPKPRTAERPPIAARPKRPPRMVTNPQKAKMAVLVHSLDEAASPIPANYAGAEDWIGVLKMRLQGEYEVGSRTELTAEQASQLIDWLEAQAIPVLMPADQWIVVPNWEKFQGYSDRNPLWIKLFTELGSKDEWCSLTDANCGVLVKVWIEYARSGGVLSVQRMLTLMHRSSRSSALDSLVRAGFIQLSASKPSRARARSREKRREEKKELTKSTFTAKTEKPYAPRENVTAKDPVEAIEKLIQNGVIQDEVDLEAELRGYRLPDALAEKLKAQL